MGIEDYTRSKEQLAALPISKVVSIDHPTVFRYHTSMEEKGSRHADGSGNRVYGVLDKDGNLYARWTDRDELADLPTGIAVQRSASSIDDQFGFNSFSMTTRVTIEPHACPVMIYTYAESYIRRGGKRDVSITYYATKVEQARSS